MTFALMTGTHMVWPRAARMIIVLRLRDRGSASLRFQLFQAATDRLKVVGGVRSGHSAPPRRCSESPPRRLKFVARDVSAFAVRCLYVEIRIGLSRRAVDRRNTHIVFAGILDLSPEPVGRTFPWRT